jgi:hypothetical protein
MIQIQQIIDDDLQENRKERTGEVSMSGLGSCIRKLMMQERKYEAIPFDGRQLRVFAMGFMIEKFVLDKLEAKGYIFKRQESTEYRGIKGTSDAIIIDSDNKKTLIDTKSVHSMKFNYLDKGETDPNYAMQLWGYQLGLQEKYDLSPLPSLVYISKDDWRIARIPVPKGNWQEQVDTKIDKVNFWRGLEELPPEKEVINWECFSGTGKKCRAWCRYIKHCPKVYKRYIEAGGKH